MSLEGYFYLGFFNRFFATLGIKFRMMTTILVKISMEDLKPKELEAWHQHKQEGYAEFVDLKE
ncbi:hypothetical protein OAD49_00905 [Flavobacteriaceae bacterium]|nr:hypothetical protein [Flavobacteriaceae bacterium]